VPHRKEHQGMTEYMLLIDSDITWLCSVTLTICVRCLLANQ